MATVVRNVTLRGIKDIMFDRYAGDNNTKLEVYNKLYLQETEGNPIIGLPAANVKSFLSAVNTTSAPKRLLDSRKYTAMANAALSFVDIDPQFIPLLRNGEPLRFGMFDEETGRDPVSNAYIHRSVARLAKGVPNPKVRPVIPLPWELKFKLTIYNNSEITEAQVRGLFTDGGVALGLGTFRGVFGKFEVVEWE